MRQYPCKDIKARLFRQADYDRRSYHYQHEKKEGNSCLDAEIKCGLRLEKDIGMEGTIEQEKGYKKESQCYWYIF